MPAPFEMRFVAGAEDIDALGHVNNAVWVRWMEAVASAHWRACADAAYVDAYLWVVTRHEIDYRGNLGAGEGVTARTWAAGPPRGARFDRIITFVGDDGREKVSARTTWAMIDPASGRILRVPAAVAASFLG